MSVQSWFPITHGSMLCNLSASHKRTISALLSRRVVCSQPLPHRHFFTRNLAAFGLDMPLRGSLQRKFLENLDVIGTSRSLTIPPQTIKEIIELNRFVKKYVKSRMCPQAPACQRRPGPPSCVVSVMQGVF